MNTTSKKIATWLSLTYWSIITCGMLALLSSIHHNPVNAAPLKNDTLLMQTSDRQIPARFTVQDRLEQFGDAVTERLLPHFETAGIAFPPSEIRLLAFKDSKHLELYARDVDNDWRKIIDYPIHAASGISGPKLREGDKQVPEGIYAIDAFNPNSQYHVSLRLNYPNTFDQQMGKRDGRKQLGSDIMIHGKAVSAGCLAMGDIAAEDLFALTAWTGREQVKVIIAPTDFRNPHTRTVAHNVSPDWTATLYQHIQGELLAMNHD